MTASPAARKKKGRTTPGSNGAARVAAQAKREAEANKPSLLGLHRIGNLQMLLTHTGEGVHMRPVAKLAKIVTDEERAKDPHASQTFEMEELYALAKLAENVAEHGSRMQVIMPGAQTPAPPRDTEPQEPADDGQASGSEDGE